MRTVGAPEGSTPRFTYRRRLAAGAALCIATTTAAVVGTIVPALANVSGVTVSLSRAAAGAQSSYTINFTTTVALVSGTDTVTLVGPAGTNFPLVAADYEIAGVAPLATPTGGGTTVTIKTNTPVPIGGVVVTAFHVTNPAAGTPTLTVQTSVEPTPVASSTYTITAATAITAVTATVAPNKVSSAVALYTIHATAATVPVSGFDSITLTAQGGTSFPLVAANYTVNAGGATTAVSATPTQSAANNVTIVVPVLSTGGSAPVAVTVTASNVTNPATVAATYNVAVVTTADSVAGTSANFALVAATAVSAVSVTPARLAAGAATTYTAAFSATTALVTTDTITMTATNTSTVFPLAAGNYTVADNAGTPVAVATTSQATTHDITLTVPAAITAGDTVAVAAVGVVNPGAGATSSSVATTQDTTPVTGPYTISAATAVTAVSAAPLPLTAGGSSTYTVGFTATTALVSGSGTITIASAGTTFPAISGSIYTVKDGAGAATAVTVGTVSANTVTITTPVTITAASAVVVVVTGVTNPGIGGHTLNVNTSQDSTAVASNSYALATSVGSTVTAVVTPTTTLAAATYTVTFVATTALLTTDTIAIVAPTGTSFPLTMANYTVADNAVAPVTALFNPTHATSPADVVVRLPATIAAGHTVTLVATGVTNPAAGTDTLTAATSKDAAAITSGTYSITSVVGGGGTGGTTPTVPATPVRIFGSDRFGTAIAASRVEFPISGTAGAVVLARADDYPDALVGAALASAKNAPLLFANGGQLTPATQAEIQRALPAGGTVYLLGGTAAIPATVATSLTSLGFVPVRYAGTDRFGTALAVADALNDPGTVLLATGVNFPDALAAGPAAAHVHGVVLLTNGSSLTPAVTAYLAAHPGTVYVIGGPAVAADPSATALSGTDRYATAAAVASTLFLAPAKVGVASGTAFPDALSGGAFQAHFGGPILLTDPRILPTSTSAYLTGAKTTVIITSIFGGTAAVSATAQGAIGTALGL